MSVCGEKLWHKSCSTSSIYRAIWPIYTCPYAQLGSILPSRVISRVVRKNLRSENVPNCTAVKFGPGPRKKKGLKLRSNAQLPTQRCNQTFFAAFNLVLALVSLNTEISQPFGIRQKSKYPVTQARDKTKSRFHDKKINRY